MGSKKDGGRRPFRFLFKLMVFAGILGAAGRFLISKRDEYAGLSESEARARMQTKLAPRFGDEKAREIADQVIPVLADRGLFHDGVSSSASDGSSEASEEDGND